MPLNKFMTVDETGRRFIEQWEESGVPLLKARWDALGGCWEIGFGHTSAAGKPQVRGGMIITADEADEILAADLASVQVNCNHLLNVPINQNQFNAVASFDFNTGGLERSSLLRAINASLTRDQIKYDFLLWDHAGGKFVQGLYNRRLAEFNMYNTAVPITAANMPQEPLTKPGG